jgi:hypothetical protein
MVWLSILLSCFIINSGCDRLRELHQAAESLVTEEGDEDRVVKQMMAAYARGYNEVLASFEDLVDNYSKAIPFDREPSPKFDDVTFFGSGSYELSLPTITEAFSDAAAIAPSKYQSFQPLAENLLGSCMELATVYGQARSYYQTRAYEKDGYEHGRQLHQRMKHAVGRFEVALRLLEEALSGEENRLMAEELLLYSNEQTCSYQYRNIHGHAKEVVVALDGHPRGDSKFGLAAERLLVAHRELLAYVEARDTIHPTCQAFTDQLERFVAALNRYRLSSESAHSNPEDLARDHDALISAYNSLIALRNSLSQLEAEGILE